MAPQVPRSRRISIIELESDFSDGSSKYWPKEGNYDFRPKDDYYHKSLAAQWMDSIGQAEKDLPKDYAIYTKTRKNSTHVDRYLYGHPKGKFDSPIKFFVHFKHLMSGGQSECDCVNCKPSKAYTSQRPAGQRLPGRKSLGQPADVTAKAYINKEKNPAQKYIDLLYRGHDIKIQHLPLDFNYGDPVGWNYRLFNPHTEYKSSHHEHHSFEPRENEIVLFYEEQQEIRLEESTQYLRLFNETTQSFDGWPKWEAGRVVSSPETGRIHIEDLSFSALKGNPKLASYICIEVLPSDSLTYSSPRRLKVEISHIRPFSMLRELQHGQDQKLWEDNIMSTAHMMSKLFLVEPCAFTRLCPSSAPLEVASEPLHAKFRCRGIWLGAEKIVEGDVVRLMPFDNKGIIDHVLIVEEISYVYEHLEAVLPAGNIFIEGRCLTLTPPHPNSNPMVSSNSTYDDLALLGLPKCMRGFTWYDTGNNELNNRFPPDSILGRCYEREAMELLIYAPNLNIGLEGVYELRRWAMAKQNKNKLGWTWAKHHNEKESYVHLNDLRTGKRRAIECDAIHFGSNLTGGFDRPSFKDTSGREDESHEGESGALNKISTISASVTLGDIEDEADIFVREALESSFADEADEDHIAKKLRI